LSNKRKFKRYVKHCEAEFEAHGKWFKGTTSDFSFNGLFIRTRHPLPADTHVTLRLHLPDDRISTISGRVMRATMDDMLKIFGKPMKSMGKDGMGIEIQERDAHYLDFIRAVISEKGENISECCVTQESLSNADTAKSPASTVSEKDDIEHLRFLLSRSIQCQEALINILERKGLFDRDELMKEIEKLRKTSEKAKLDRVFFI
jgi:hypothetical protein